MGDAARSVAFRAVVRQDLVNTCRNRIRATRWQATDISAEVALATGDNTGRVEDRDVIGAAIGALSPDHQVVIALRYYRDLTVDDIARRLGVPAGTVQSRLHYALKRLHDGRCRRRGDSPMTDRELEERLRAWYGTHVGETETAPADLRQTLTTIPATMPVPLRARGGRRPFTLLAVAAVLVVGGAFAAGPDSCGPSPW